MARHLAIVTLSLLLGCCDASKPSDARPAPDPSASAAASRARRGVEIRRAEGRPGALLADVQKAKREVEASGRTLLVYVGASWCEPCQRFHRAAEAGELDARFPDLVLLEFDKDRDGAELDAAGYRSRYIPLFAVPNADGSSSGKQMEGSIKGPGAVAEMSPRLQQLLGR